MRTPPSTVASGSEEARRLEVLTELSILDTPPEPAFDGLAEAAALVCGMPIALVSVIDADRQWIKANVGLPGVTETPREAAFCAEAMRQDGILEIPDTTLDPRFADNPFVTGAPHIRFYASASLCLGDGTEVGTLCVVDRKPGRLTARQRAVLSHLAAAAVQALEGRRTAYCLGLSESRFRAFSESAPLGVFGTDARGACTYTNTRCQAIFGLSAAQTRGHGWYRALHPDDRAAVQLEWERAATGAFEFERELRIVGDDGVVRHVRVLVRPVLAEDGTVRSRVGSVEDITERRTQELALRRSETLLAETGALADVGGWELELPSGLLTLSEQTCRIYGVAPGYRPALDEAVAFYAPEARPVIRAAVKHAIATGKGWDLELPFVRADGERIWVRALGRVELEGGTPVRLLGAFKNITRRVRQRQALESAHERMVLATESGRIGLWDWDLGRNTIDATAQMRELFELPPAPESITPEAWLERVHPEDRRATENLVRAALAGGEDLEAEFRIIRDDGGLRHLRIAAQVKRGTDGEVTRLLGANWDVTPLRELGDELAVQHELMQVTLQSIGDAVITSDATGRVTWLNPVAERMTGWLSAEAAGRPLAQVFHIVHVETRQPVADPVTACLRRGATAGLPGHTVLISRTGEEFGVEESAAPIRRDGGVTLGAVLVFHDVTEQRRLSGEMSYRATHDALTGLVNRVEFEHRLEQVLTRVHEERTEHALMYIDLDQFKLVNDACGHSVGDQLLQQVAEVLAGAVRSHDTLARVGGDEFAIILENCASGRALRVAQTICDRMGDFRFLHDGRRFHIGASIGLVPIDGRWSAIAPALQAADASCYAAKEAGRNRVHAWLDTDQSLQARHRETEWATRLAHALDDGRFALHTQRIEAASGTRGGLHAEVLVRLHDDDGRLIPPSAFLPAAERFHFATRIDRWVLRRVIEHVESLPDLSALDTLCVNISGQSVGDRAFHRDAIAALKRAGGEICRRLCLEITETAAITNMADAVVFAEQVQAFGVRIALDDFGAGASSFGYLRTLPVDVLKIDGRYIRNMLDDPLDDAAVRCFVEVARVKDIRTVAEHVDRPELLERAREIGIDHVQGFLLHEPEPIERVLGLPAAALAGERRVRDTTTGVGPVPAA